MNNNMKKGSFPVHLVVFVILAFLVGTLMGSCTKEFMKKSNYKHNSTYFGFNVYPGRSQTDKYLLRDEHVEDMKQCVKICHRDAECRGFSVSKKHPNKCRLMKVNVPDGRNRHGTIFFGKP